MRRLITAAVAVALTTGLTAAVAPAGTATTAMPTALPGSPAPTVTTAALFLRWPLLEVGSAGRNVQAAKYFLRARGYSTDNDPTYRTGTRDTMKTFQTRAGLTVDGLVGQQTWQALFVTLRPGSTSPAVHGLQMQLTKNGYGVRESGVYDAATLAAVLRLKAARGLPNDGIVGTGTWSTLVQGSLSASVVRKGTTTKKLVALTFDAGSDLGQTFAILDTLKNAGIKATFGLTGEWVVAHPNAAKRIVSDGHEVVNHTYDHPSFTGFSNKTHTALTLPARQSEIDKAWAAIDRTNHARFTWWFRPPYGDRDASVDRDVSHLGYNRELMWTVDTLGWEGVSASTVVSRVVAAATPGEIVLMHVGTGSTDYRALPTVISRLRSMGYGFATVDGVMS